MPVVPVRKELREFSLHLLGGEVAVDRKHDIRGKEVALVESDQVLALDAV